LVGAELGQARRHRGRLASEVGIHLNGAWYDRLPAVTAEIDCGGARHRITWRSGRLVLEDHDVVAEQSLVALGAKPPMCLELLDAWRARRDSELVCDLLLRDGTISSEELALSRARHESELDSARSMAQRMRAHVRDQPDRAERVRLAERQAVERLEREARLWAITLTEGLPPRLRRALALSVIHKIERQWDDEGFRREHARDVEPALTALAIPPFEQSARQWSRNLKPYRGFAAHAGLLGPGEEPACALWADRAIVHATVSLPLSWFADVWARGIALVDGYFVMAVTDSSADGMKLRVLAVRFVEGDEWKRLKPLEAPALLTRGRVSEWHLHWVV